MSACTGRSPSRARPFRKSSSMTNAKPSTVPPWRSTSRAVAAALSDGVLVHLEGVGAVLERVGLARGAIGQLARLAHRHEADAEPIGQRRAEDEAARLDAH